MPLKFKTDRCKSTTDILNEGDEEKENLWPKNSRLKSHSTDEINSNDKKSNGFVKKFREKMARLEKRNELCKANDEFWAMYCTSNPYQRLQTETDALDRLIRNRIAAKQKNIPIHRRFSLNGSLMETENIRRAASSDTRQILNREEHQTRSVTLERSSKKGLRKKSFRKFLGSVMKWGKSKEEPRRFLSCENLIDDSSDSRADSVEELSKTSSMDAVTVLDCDDRRTTEEFHKLTRPDYKPNLRRIRTEWQKRESITMGDFADFRNLADLTDSRIERSMDSLWKPTTITGIARRLSQHEVQSRLQKY